MFQFWFCLGSRLGRCSPYSEASASTVRRGEQCRSDREDRNQTIQSHATHPPEQSAKPWFDLTGLPSPSLAAGLGDHHYGVTAGREEARAFFNQGLIYAYGFNHLEALRAFREAQTLDPDCAMCFWGEDLNMPMETAAAPLARVAAEKAVSPPDTSCTCLPTSICGSAATKMCLR
jgi:hypothetical protein